MFFLPNRIGKNFKNLETLVVNSGLGTKLIKRSNLLNLEKLRGLHIYRNEIEILHFDTLWDLPVLGAFALINNKLNELDKRTFEKNGRLTRVNLSFNRLEFLPRHIFKANVLLNWVNLDENPIKSIATDFTALPNIKNIFLHNNACIDKCYSNGKTFIFICNSPKEVSNLSEFQRQIKRNCTDIRIPR